MKALAIARVALIRFVRDRGNLFFVFVLPIGIIMLIGAQFGGGFAPTVAINAAAAADIVAEEIAASLRATPEIDLVVLSDRQALVDAVALGEAAVALYVPAGLSGRLEAGARGNVELIAPVGGVVRPYEVILRRAVALAGDRESIIRYAVSRGASREAATAAAPAVAEGAPRIDVEVTAAGESLFSGVSGRFEIGATGQLILFMFLTGLTGSAALIQARRLGVTRRILGTPTGAFELIAGEGLGQLAVVLVQGLYIVLASALIFGTDWGNLLGAAAVILAFGVVGAGAAMLFGTLFSNDQQAAGVGVVVGLGLAAIGGCMVPLELFPDAMETVAYFTPHAWALDAMGDLQRRGATVIDILPQLGVILAFAAALLALASWRMRATLGKA